MISASMKNLCFAVIEDQQGLTSIHCFEAEQMEIMPPEVEGEEDQEALPQTKIMVSKSSVVGICPDQYELQG